MYITNKLIKRMVDYQEINTKDQRTLEFMYLITFRAYMNVTRAKQFFSKNRTPMVQSFSHDIAELLAVAKKNFQHYSQILF